MFADFLAAMSPLNVGLAVLGVVGGTVIGALPGLTATMAVAVLTPLTFGLPPATALIVLGAIYTGAIYGGCFAAILVNTPGTPSSIATTFDGYPMAKAGRGGLAISLATFASVAGGLIGALALLLVAPPLARLALAFGPVEYFWLAILGLTMVASLSEGSTLKGLIGCGLGLFVAMIGSAVVGGDMRFTANLAALSGGVHIVVALIGLFCIPVVIELAAKPDAHLEAAEGGQSLRMGEALGHCRRGWLNLLRGSLIGSFVGALPAAGGSIASLIAYNEARRGGGTSFGRGEPQGIIAAETANNATVGGGFIPTLVLGIPGTPPDAIILGALLVHGVRTGPNLFTAQSAIVYTFIFGLILATILMLPIGLLIGRYAFKALLAVPKRLLVPLILLLTILGTYAVQNSIIDVWLMLAIGIAGWFMARAGFAAAPIVLGVVLGSIAEQGFVQAWLIGGAQGDRLGMFFGRPISLVILAFIVLALAYPLLARRLGTSVHA